MTQSRYFVLRIFPAIAFAALIFGLSATPGNELHAPNIPDFDKFAHLVAYAVFGFLICRAGKPRWILYAFRPWVVAAVLLGWFYGASDEFHQSFVPLRSVSVWDWVFDAIGGVVGVYCAIILSRKDPWRRFIL